MAAGQGFKTFATGDVLTAADTNGYLMQGVWVFADATARDAAVTSPQEGNMCYLKSTDTVQYYSGSAWTAVGGSTSPLTTKGDIWGYSTTNARIPVGTNGQVLTADSTQALGVKWATAAGGGKVLQAVSATTNTTVTNSTNTYTDTGLTASITPSASTSKVLVLVTQNGLQKSAGNAGSGLDMSLFRGATNLGNINSAAMYTNSTLLFTAMSSGIAYLDSPATTSSTTYKTQFKNRIAAASVSVQEGNETSSIVLLEIGA